MLELRNAVTGELIGGNMAHGPVYDPMGLFMHYVIVADCSKFTEQVKAVLIDREAEHAIAHFTVNPMPPGPGTASIKRVMLPPNAVPDPRLGDGQPTPVTGFLLAFDEADARAAMERKGFRPSPKYPNSWLDDEHRLIFLPQTHYEMRGRAPSVVYATENFTQRSDAEIFAQTAKLALKFVGGEITVI